MKQIILDIKAKLPKDAILFIRYLHILSVAIDLPITRNDKTLEEAVWLQYGAKYTPMEQASEWYNNLGLVRTMVELDVEYYLKENNLNFSDIFG